MFRIKKLSPHWSFWHLPMVYILVLWLHNFSQVYILIKLSWNFLFVFTFLFKLRLYMNSSLVFIWIWLYLISTQYKRSNLTWILLYLAESKPKNNPPKFKTYWSDSNLIWIGINSNSTWRIRVDLKLTRSINLKKALCLCCQLF